MIDATRRGFLAGALGSTVAPALADAQVAAPTAPGKAKQRIVRRGRAITVSPRGGSLVVAHERRRTIAIAAGKRRRLIDVGGQPLELAVSPDGRLAAVTTAFWDEPGLALVDLRAGRLRRRLEVGPAPFGVAFAPDGTQLIVSGGEGEGQARVVDVARQRLAGSVDVGVCPRAVAIVPGEERAWVVLNGLDRLVQVDLRGPRIVRTLRVPALPDRVAVSPDGSRLLVSHCGPDSGRISEIELPSGRVRRLPAGPQPSAVAWGPRGSRLVALGGAGEILAISAGGRRSHHRVHSAPRGLAVAGNRAWTVDAHTGQISGVRL